MYLLYDLYHYHIKYESDGGLKYAYSSLMIAYYKFIPHAYFSLNKSLSFVLCFRTMHDLLSCLNFLLVFFFSLREETNKLLALEVYFSYEKKKKMQNQARPLQLSWAPGPWMR